MQSFQVSHLLTFLVRTTWSPQTWAERREQRLKSGRGTNNARWRSTSRKLERCQAIASGWRGLVRSRRKNEISRRGEEKKSRGDKTTERRLHGPEAWARPKRRAQTKWHWTRETGKKEEITSQITFQWSRSEETFWIVTWSHYNTANFTLQKIKKRTEGERGGRGQLFLSMTGNRAHSCYFWALLLLHVNSVLTLPLVWQHRCDNFQCFLEADKHWVTWTLLSYFILFHFVSFICFLKYRGHEIRWEGTFADQAQYNNVHREKQQQIVK